MKPDPYKAKASAAWKRKNTKEYRKTVQYEQSLDVEDVEDVEDAEDVEDLERDTSLLRDLKNKLILNDDKCYEWKSIPSDTKPKFKFTIVLETNVENTFKKNTYKGFHEQIFAPLMQESTIKSMVKEKDLEEWLDDILC